MTYETPSIQVAVPVIVHHPSHLKILVVIYRARR